MEKTSRPAMAMNIIPGKTPVGRCWFLMYAGVFVVFTFNLLPINLAVLAMVAVFLTAPGSVLPYLYFFSFPWALVATFDFGLTLSLIQSIIYMGRMFKARQTVRFSHLELIVLVYLLGQSFLGFLNNGSTTPLSYVFYFLIVCHVRTSYFRDPVNRHDFLRNMLFSVMVSVGIATIYGLVNGTSLDRYISGLGYASQMSGTLGTTRFAMYLLIALIYPLYCMDNRKWKLTLSILGSLGVIATLSLTSLVILSIVWSYYFVTSGGKWKTLLLVAMAGGIVLLGGTLLWNQISANPFLHPMAVRVEQTLDALKSGDLNSATTGRVNLLDSYLAKFSDAPLLGQIFGNQTVRFGSDQQYSHNSYVDMLNCIGIIGVALLSCLQISRIREYFKCPERDLLLLLKFVALLTAATVSIFSVQFWQVFLYF